MGCQHQGGQGKEGDQEQSQLGKIAPAPAGDEQMDRQKQAGRCVEQEVGLFALMTQDRHHEQADTGKGAEDAADQAQPVCSGGQQGQGHGQDADGTGHSADGGGQGTGVAVLMERAGHHTAAAKDDPGYGQGGHQPQEGPRHRLGRVQGFAVGAGTEGPEAAKEAQQTTGQGQEGQIVRGQDFFHKGSLRVSKDGCEDQADRIQHRLVQEVDPQGVSAAEGQRLCPTGSGREKAPFFAVQSLAQRRAGQEEAQIGQ